MKQWWKLIWHQPGMLYECTPWSYGERSFFILLWWCNCKYIMGTRCCELSVPRLTKWLLPPTSGKQRHRLTIATEHTLAFCPGFTLTTMDVHWCHLRCSVTVNGIFVRIHFPYSSVYCHWWNDWWNSDESSSDISLVCFMNAPPGAMVKGHSSFFCGDVIAST